MEEISDNRQRSHKNEIERKNKKPQEKWQKIF